MSICITTCRGGPSPVDGQLEDPVDRGVLLEGHLLQLRRESQTAKAAVEGAVHDLQLQPGQLLPQALMHAEAEGDVLPVDPGDVEPVGFGKDSGVPVAQWRSRASVPSAIMFAVVSCPAISSRTPICAASDSVSSPDLTRSTTPESRSSPGSVSFSPTRPSR